MSIITCECGAKVRLPAEAASRSLRCPQCKTGLAIATNAVVLSSVPLSVGQAAVCSICQTSIAAGEGCVTCPGCDQVHHAECWAEIGGCGTYGCAETPAPDKSEQSAAAPVSAWGDSKKCPACGEQIKAIALRCRYCQTDFSSVDPMSANDLRWQAAVDEQLIGLKRNVVILFATSLVAVLAPLILIVGLIYLLPKRKLLAKCGPLFTIMGWTAIVLSAFYSVLLLIFIAVEMGLN